MNLNKLIHETRLMCWHEASEYSGQCSKCETLRRHWDPNPDYENDMDACMELWKEAQLYDLVLHKAFGNMMWIASLPPRDNDPLCEYVDGGCQDTPQLAIIHAYLKSKGVELEDEG